MKCQNLVNYEISQVKIRAGSYKNRLMKKNRANHYNVLKNNIFDTKLEHVVK